MAIVHVRGVPEELHRAVKHECVDTKESMSEFAITAMRHELERRGKPVTIEETSDG